MLQCSTDTGSRCITSAVDNKNQPSINALITPLHASDWQRLLVSMAFRSSPFCAAPAGGLPSTQPTTALVKRVCVSALFSPIPPPTERAQANGQEANRANNETFFGVERMNRYDLKGEPSSRFLSLVRPRWFFVVVVLLFLLWVADLLLLRQGRHTVMIL